MLQTSCSELLVDTKIHDSRVAYDVFRELFDSCGLESSPPLSVELLEKLKERDLGTVLVYDARGNHCFLEYGDNGYISDLGFRFDSQCNDYDKLCYPLFRLAIEKLNGELISCDGGHTDGYLEWAKKHKATKKHKASRG